MDKLKIGIIGVGNITQVAHLPILSKINEVEVSAVCDHDIRRAKLISEKYKIKHTFKHYSELIACKDVDAVIIATPTHTHKEIAIDAIKEKKTCFVEKPLARTAPEAKQILDVVKKYNGIMMVGMNQRFRPDALILKSFIQNGEIGDIFFIKCGWLQKNPVDKQWKVKKKLSGGGVFVDLGIMVLDLALWILDFPEPKSVCASHYSRSNESVSGGNNVEDFSSVFVRLKTGQSITIDTSWNFEVDKDMLFCNAYGDNGYGRVHPLMLHKKIKEKLVNVTPKRLGTLENIYKRSYYNQLTHFVGAARGLYTMTSSCRESYERLLIVDAVYKSAKTRKEVLL